MREEPYYQPFVALCQLCNARGEDSLGERVPPGATWPVPIDGRWSARINPHGVPAQLPGGGELGAYSATVSYNGWPWAVMDPGGGIHGTHPDPEGATLEQFSAAVNAAIAAEEGGSDG